MTSSLEGLLSGFGLALTWSKLGFALIGCLLGTLIGVLPGIGPLATVSMLLSMTVFLDPLSSLVMLAAIYYGAQYGGSTTAILCNLPGEASSVVTTLDGHKMAQNGRAGAALATAALASLFAGVVGTLIIALFGPVLSGFALNFNAPEYFALMVLGVLAAVVFSHGSSTKAMAMAAMGVLFGLVGTDVETGAARMTFGSTSIGDGLGVVGVSMGLFGLGEIIYNLTKAEKREVMAVNVGKLWLTMKEFKAAWPATVRGTAIGSVLGILPGGGVMLSTFAAYIAEQSVAKDPSRFGKGAIEGVAAPEAGEQRGGADVVHPVAHARHPDFADARAAAGRDDHPGHPAGSRSHDQAARSVLGADREHVHRQRDAGRDQSAADPHVGAAAQGAVPDPVPGDHHPLLHRRLFARKLRAPISSC